MTTRGASLFVIGRISLGLAGAVWSFAGHACSDPSPMFVYDPVMWSLAMSNEGIEEFLDRRYGSESWQFNKDVVRILPPKQPYGNVAINLHLTKCKSAANCSKVEVFAVVDFIYLKDRRKHRSGPTILPLFSVDRFASRPRSLGFHLDDSHNAQGIIAAVRHIHDSKVTWQVHLLSEDLRDPARCGWKEFAESEAWASFYDFCYTYSRGGYYYDPWPPSDIKSAMCQGSGTDERILK